MKAERLKHNDLFAECQVNIFESWLWCKSYDDFQIFQILLYLVLHFGRRVKSKYERLELFDYCDEKLQISRINSIEIQVLQVDFDCTEGFFGLNLLYIIECYAIVHHFVASVVLFFKKLWDILSLYFSKYIQD